MIRTENLSRHYRRMEALRGLNLDVPAGSAFAVVGANGAGKSTLIKILMNLTQPSEGRAEVMGVDSRRLGAAQLAQIGYVSENQQLPEWMRVSYFLEYCRGLYPAWDRALAAALVEQFELPLNRRLGELSRGMKVKAALAASLAYRPRLIILDEPFSGLDVLVREQLIESLVDCTPEATIVIASHDLAEIETFATHVAYLSEGKLAFCDEMDTLAARFREVQITFDRPAPAMAGAPSSWLNAQAEGVVVTVTDAGYEAERLREEASGRFGGIREIQARPMSLRSIALAMAKSRRGR